MMAHSSLIQIRKKYNFTFTWWNYFSTKKNKRWVQWLHITQSQYNRRQALMSVTWKSYSIPRKAEALWGQVIIIFQLVLLRYKLYARKFTNLTVQIIELWQITTIQYKTSYHPIISPKPLWSQSLHLQTGPWATLILLSYWFWFSRKRNHSACGLLWLASFI